MSDARISARLCKRTLKQDHRTVQELIAETAMLEEGEPLEKERLIMKIDQERAIHSVCGEQQYSIRLGAL